MTVDEFQIVLKKHGFNYGWDAASNALVGYEIALASRPLTPEMAQSLLVDTKTGAFNHLPQRGAIVAALRATARGVK